MLISLNEYVLLCMDVYFPEVEFDKPYIIKNSSFNEKINGFYKNSPLKPHHGWTRLYQSEPVANGFYAAYYIKNSSKKGVIVFRGSDDFYDFAYHDLKMAVGEWPVVRLNAINFYNLIIREYSPEFLAISGHSLGGALAQLIGVQVNKKRSFNSQHPIICFNAPQMGYLIHDNPERKILSNIDNKNKEFENSIKEAERIKHLCNIDLNKLGISSSALNLVKGFHQNTYCVNAQRANIYSKLGNYFSYYKKSLDDLSQIYKNICSYKDINKTVDFGQPAFNTIYDLLDIKSRENIQANDFNFISTCQKYQKEYDYIFNFNSYYDVVHVCGKPLGHQINIDIDKPEYLKYWGDTGEIFKFNSQYDYKKSQAYKARLKCELRACLTLSDEYQNYQNIRKTNKAKSYNLSSLLKQNITRHCQNTFLKNSLSQVDLSVPEIIDILAGLKLNMPNYETDKLNELIYMAKTQHVMANIGNVIQNEPMLKNISIGANYKQVPNDLKRFTDKHKLNLDESSERLKFIIKELGLVLDEYCLPEEVRA